VLAKSRGQRKGNKGENKRIMYKRKEEETVLSSLENIGV
jgi:hypothetical protein